MRPDNYKCPFKVGDTLVCISNSDDGKHSYSISPRIGKKYTVIQRCSSKYREIILSPDNIAFNPTDFKLDELTLNTFLEEQPNRR